MSFTRMERVSRMESRLLVGIDPVDDGYSRLLTPEQIEQIKVPDRVIFDQMGRPEYGPVADMYGRGERVETAINDREISVAGLYAVGTSFGLDGGVVTSDLNLQRIFPGRSASAIDLGLIALEPGAAPLAVRAMLGEQLATDVVIMTPEEFKDKEIRHWNKTTPVGYLFAFGAVIGVVVGFIMVY